MAVLISTITSSPKLILALAAAALVLNIAYRYITNPLRSVPGPWYAKVSRLRLKYAIVTGQRMQYIQQLHERYGKVVLVGPEEVSTTDAEDFSQIHRVAGPYQKTTWYQKFVAFDRNILFTMVDNKEHAARRKILARAFSQTHLQEHWEPTVHEHIKFAMSQMAEEGAQGTLDILKWWTFMSTDVSSTVMFGESFHVMEAGRMNEYMRALAKGAQGSGIAVELPLVAAIGRLIPTENCRLLFHNSDIIQEYGQMAVSNSRDHEGNKNIFAKMNAEAEKGEVLDDTDVVCESSGLIVAGTDTTAMSLTYLVWAILSHPEWQQKLVEELNNLSENFTDRDLTDLPILDAVIQESLRLYTPAQNSLPRAVPSEGARISNHYLPAGTTVSTQAHSLHRDPELFPNPSAFDPSRWLTEGAVSKAAKSVYNPFGAGKYVCAGIHLAKMELRLSAAEFFRSFPNAELGARTTKESMEMENFFLIAPKSHRCEVELGESRLKQ